MKELLKKQVEEMAGWPCRVAGDFVRLSDLISERTRERLSASTLRRLWGYDSEGVEARQYTLDVLARFLGYRHYDDFKQKNGLQEAQSGFVLWNGIRAEELALGERLRLTWHPDRTCIIEYDGDGRFTVVSAKNTRLTAGDTFECHTFIAHEPLYLDRLVHDGAAPCPYVVGKVDGIMVERLQTAEE